MPLITTPGQLSKRAEMYQQLAQLTTAGLGMVQSLQQIQRNPPNHADREPLQQAINSIAQGRTFTQAVTGVHGWLPEFDLALIQAGETSGRLDAAFRALAVHYTDRARSIKQLISQLIYPVFLIHFAAFVFFVIVPFAHAGLNFDRTLVWICIKAGLILLPFYVGTFLLVYSLQSKHAESWRATVESVLYAVPVLGTTRNYLALARLASALEALISAGVNVIEAWELAANASGSPALKQIVLSWKPRLAAGRTPAELVRDSPRFPSTFSNLYTTGEVSGQIDESLRKLHTYYQDEGSRKLDNLTSLLSKGIYILVMISIAYFIIHFYEGQFGKGSDLDKAINGFQN
jgi:type IV pilus assembly protein PilC